jgi:hypothetical protein
LEAPHFVDNEMIYYNTFLQEFYVFDAEGKWVLLNYIVLRWIK